MPKPAPKILDNPEVLYRVSRDVAVRMLDLSPRNFHHLVSRGILPAPLEHGCYDLPAVIDAFLCYKAKIEIPTTLAEAEIAIDLAERARRVFLRQQREGR